MEPSSGPPLKHANRFNLDHAVLLYQKLIAIDGVLQSPAPIDKELLELDYILHPRYRGYDEPDMYLVYQLHTLAVNRKIRRPGGIPLAFHAAYRAAPHGRE
jgi:hypothetical protein